MKESKKLRVIIDTDTACEADDPFAIAYALMSPKLIVKAIVAEHFARPGSMEKSFEAARKVTQAMGSAVPVLHGEEGPEGTGGISEGVETMIREARTEESRPLFILCMGALTNVDRALREAPDIAQAVTIVTIGGHGYETSPIPWREFNFGNDVAAANRVLQSGAEVWQIPADVYGTIRVGLAELQEQVMPYGAIGRYLFEQMVAYNATPEAEKAVTEAEVLFGAGSVLGTAARIWRETEGKTSVDSPMTKVNLMGNNQYVFSLECSNMSITYSKGTLNTKSDILIPSLKTWKMPSGVYAPRARGKQLEITPRP